MKLTPDDSDSGNKSKGKAPEKVKKPSRFEIVVANCKICNLPHSVRASIDMLVTTGWTQTAVKNHWNELLEEEYGPDYISAVNISTHSRKHISARASAIRAIVEARALHLVESIDGTKDFLLTKEAVVDSIMASGLQNIVQGLVTVEPKDALQAVALAKQFEDEIGNVGIDALWNQFYAFNDAVKKVVPVIMYERIAKEFESLMSGTPIRFLQLEAGVEGDPVEIIDDAEIEAVDPNQMALFD